jgi:hypothetical protein
MWNIFTYNPSGSLPFYYQLDTIGLLPLVIFIVGLVICLISKNTRRVISSGNNNNKYLFIGLFILLLSLYVCVLGLSPLAERQLLDMPVIIGMISAAIIGIYINENSVGTRRVITAFIIIGIILAGSFGNIKNLTLYDSAMTKSDTEAIEYVNSLPGDTYTSNVNVGTLVYGVYINKQYVNTQVEPVGVDWRYRYKVGDANILVIRNKIQSPSDMPNYPITFVYHGTDNTSGYTLAKEFADGNDGIIVDVYTKGIN